MINSKGVLGNFNAARISALELSCGSNRVLLVVGVGVTKMLFLIRWILEILYKPSCHFSFQG